MAVFPAGRLAAPGFTAAIAALSMGCELPEITVPPGGTTVVVQGVLRPDRAQQWLVVEQSYNGTIDPGDNFGGVIPFPGGSETPVSGAQVVVTNLAQGPCQTTTFRENLAPDEVRSGVYWAPVGCPSMEPGDTLELRVVTPLATVTGSTTLPLVMEMKLRTNQGSVAMPASDLVFNRDSDTLLAEVDAVSGRAIQLSVSRVATPGRYFVVGSFGIGVNESPIVHANHLWADSNAMTLPGDFINVFESDFDPDQVTPDLFSAGFTYHVFLSYTDTNYYNALRSGNSPLSGRGFINSLDGGFGFFGSLVGTDNRVRAVGSLDDPREGVYRLAGTVRGVAVDLRVEVYLGRSFVDRAEMFHIAAFISGQWVLGPIDDSAEGTLIGTNALLLLGQATGQVGPHGIPEVRGWRLSGDLSGDSLDVGTLESGTILGRLSVTRESVP